MSFFYKSPIMQNSNFPGGRRRFIKDTIKVGAGSVVLAGFPTIVPSTVFGKNAPSNKINIGQIGCGRIASTHDLPEIFKYDVARIMAIADLDKNRQVKGKQ